MNSQALKPLRSILVSLRGVQRRMFFGSRATPLPLDTQLRLQASLDGELYGNKVQPTAEAPADEAEAQFLLRELSLVKSALAGNETERLVPQNRECYWGKIEQAIAGMPRREPADVGRVPSGDRGSSRPAACSWVSALSRS